SREPLQFGAEIYGYAGREADLEILELAQASLRGAGVGHLQLDLADVRVIDAVLAPVSLSVARTNAIHAALTAKDVAELKALSVVLPIKVREGLSSLTGLFGDVSMLGDARRVLPPSPALDEALDNLAWLAAQVRDMDVSIDLADLRGYAYYTGMRFALFTQTDAGEAVELARGGRYDEVGAVFGRERPAVGFSLDFKELVSAVLPRPLVAAMRAPL